MKEAEVSVHCSVENDDPAWHVDSAVLRSLFEAIVCETRRELSDIEGVHKAVALSCYVVKAGQMQALNRQYRQHDTATDMLSFPLGYGAPGRGWVLGDIIICLSEVKSKAHSSGNTLTDQFVFSLIHSFLHLLGYDHELQQQRCLMERREESIFAAIETTDDFSRIVESV